MIFSHVTKRQTMSIAIPENFSQKLSNFTTLQLFCNSIVGYMERADFFPEYTRHGVSHVNMVLHWAEQLIPIKTLNQLSENEIIILVLSIITHDIGMFLTNDGVKKVMQKKCIDAKEEIKWGDKWQQYIKELYWLSEKRKNNIFGSSFEINPDCQFDGKTTDDDRKQCGEFLRRHHHELAQQIILDGFPGNHDKDLLEKLNIDNSIRKLIGITVRSHGMAFRDVEPLIVKDFSDLAYPYEGIRIYYIMAILRLADILDASGDRAPQAFEDKQHFESRISHDEFAINQAVKEVEKAYHPRHVLLVRAQPLSGKIYVKLENWLKQIQQELDCCWAVIGDYYEDENSLEFSIRRVKSNIWKERELFEKSFVTKPVTFKVNPDLPKLLIKPLYGDNPSYGIRELLQNAVDACREREVCEIEKNKNQLYQGQVEVRIETTGKGEHPVIRISDNGIGMTEDVILNYYLTSGSSFKTSRQWVEDFTDNENSAKIPRGGRFGIGVLAAFLLGNQVTVTTRHISEKQGYKFTADLNADHIEIQHLDVDKVGTTIEIISSPCNFNNYKISSLQERGWNPIWWQWYHFRTPQITYRYDDIVKESSYFVPSKLEEENQDWLCLNPKEKNLLFFQPSIKEKKYFCNGIMVEFGPDFIKDDIEFKNIGLDFIDKDNQLEIDLSRKNIINFPQKNEFLNALFSYLIANWLISNNVQTGSRPINCSKSQFAISRYAYGNASPSILLSSQGYSLPIPCFMLQRQHKSFLATFGFNSRGNGFEKVMSGINMPLLLLEPATKYTIAQNFFSFITAQSYGHKPKFYVEWFRIPKDEAYIKEWNDYKSWHRDEYTIELKNEKFVYLKNKSYKQNIDHNILLKESPLLIQFCCNAKDYRADQDFKKLLKKFLPPNGWIPFDINERKQKCPPAAGKLLKRFSLSW